MRRRRPQVRCRRGSDAVGGRASEFRSEALRQPTLQRPQERHQVRLLLRREMERLSRVAHRIVWVNPRTQSPEYQPLAGGMAAAWPYCDAVVSAHSLNALDELTAALAHPGRRG